jgi:hypothetical protein
VGRFRESFLQAVKEFYDASLMALFVTEDLQTAFDAMMRAGNDFLKDAHVRTQRQGLGQKLGPAAVSANELLHLAAEENQSLDRLLNAWNAFLAAVAREIGLEDVLRSIDS